MTNKEILQKVIQKAEKNGYKEHLNYLPLLIRPIKDLDNFSKNIFYLHKNNIIYSHEFAKAFFGNEDIVYRNKAWVYRLQEMSQAEDEFKYLENFLT